MGREGICGEEVALGEGARAWLEAEGVGPWDLGRWHLDLEWA